AARELVEGRERLGRLGEAAARAVARGAVAGALRERDDLLQERDPEPEMHVVPAEALGGRDEVMERAPGLRAERARRSAAESDDLRVADERARRAVEQRGRRRLEALVGAGEVALDGEREPRRLERDRGGLAAGERGRRERERALGARPAERCERGLGARERCERGRRGGTPLEGEAGRAARALDGREAALAGLAHGQLAGRV